MNRFLIVLAIILFTSCQSDKDKLSFIFSESKITIEMNTCGCFGCCQSSIIFNPEIRKDNLVSVNGTEIEGYKEITQEELIIIRDFFLIHLESTSSLRGCTNTTEFKISGEKHQVELFEDGCQIRSSILEIIE